jgi:hypothetical protein
MRGDGFRRRGALGAERARAQFAPHVRFGSLAEVEARLRCVRSSPNSRHHSAR